MNLAATSSPATGDSPSIRRELAGCYMATVIILSILFTGYFIGLPGQFGGLGTVYVPLGIVSDAALLTLVPTLASLLGPAWVRNQFARRSVIGVIFGLTFVLFLGDIIVFRLFRRHFDAMIWNVLVTPGAADSVQAGSTNVAIEVTNDVRDFSVGIPLQRPLDGRRVTLGGWRSAALVASDSVTVFEPMRVAYFDQAFHDLPRNDPRRPKPAEVLAALNEFKAYLK